MRSTESRFQGIDQFGEKFSMKIDQEYSILNSSMGSLCTLLLLVVVGAYTYQKMNVWVNRMDTNIAMTINEAQYNSSYVFDYS